MGAFNKNAEYFLIYNEWIALSMSQKQNWQKRENNQANSSENRLSMNL